MPTAAASGLYILAEPTVVEEYVDALFGKLKSFLLLKNPGHCQRVDFLPRPVMELLGKTLAVSADLKAASIVCRVITESGVRASSLGSKWQWRGRVPRGRHVRSHQGLLRLVSSWSAPRRGRLAERSHVQNGRRGQLRRPQVPFGSPQR